MARNFSKQAIASCLVRNTIINGDLRSKRIEAWEIAVYPTTLKFAACLSEIIDYRNTDFATPLCDNIDLLLQNNLRTPQSKRLLEFMEKVERHADTGNHGQELEHELRMNELSYERGEIGEVVEMDTRRRILKDMRESRKAIILTLSDIDWLNLANV